MIVEEILEQLKQKPWIVRDWNGEQIREYENFINWDEVEFWKYGKDWIREFRKYKRKESSKWDILGLKIEYGLEFALEYYKGDKVKNNDKLYDDELKEYF